MSKGVILIAAYFVLFAEMASLEQQMSATEGVGTSLNKFFASLYKAVRSDTTGTDNKVFSPLSVAAVLSMLYPGMRGNTLLQLREVFHGDESVESKTFLTEIGKLFDSLKVSGSYELEVANRLCIHDNYPVLSDFQSLLQLHFNTSAEMIDFNNTEQARLSINNWVSDATHHKINNLIPQGALNSYTRFVLVNAVYFKGKWQVQFDPSETSVELFYPGNGLEPFDTEMMHSYTEYNTGTLVDYKARILELPYVGDVSMFIILPDSTEDLPFTEKLMQSKNVLGEAIPVMRKEKTRVALPKFKIEFEADMKNALAELGLTNLFDEKTADLSGITGKSDLFVSNVFHKAFIEVNEEGSEAAASTAGVVRMKRSAPRDEPFIVNRPCLFIVQHKPSGAWLFAGTMNKPQHAESEIQKRDEL